jgi:opacity protein-like surface antigen
MKTKTSSILLMALVAMSILKSNSSLAQAAKVFTPQIKTPETSKELTITEEKKQVVKPDEFKESTSLTPASRKLQRHGLGFGLGQTFLLGNYSKHGNDKITLDILYSYAASYSFDLLIDAHLSQHENQDEKMKLLGLNSSIKGRFVEYDNLSPFFLGGLGFYAPRAKRSSGSGKEWSDQKLTFGLNFGGGLDLRLNDHYVVGLMGQMHWPFKVQQDNQSDLKGYYFKLLITGMYLF